MIDRMGFAVAGLLLTVSAALAAPRAGRAPQAVRELQAQLAADQVDLAIETGERVLAVVADPDVALLVAEACSRKAKALDERGRASAEILAVLDRGLKAARTVKLLKWRGHTLINLGGRDHEAYEAYEEALERGVEGKDQIDLATAVADTYARIAPATCRLTVTSAPSDAEVRIGAGVESKRTPAKWWLPRGSHSVQVFALGRPAQTRVVACGPTPVAVHVDLGAAAMVAPLATSLPAADANDPYAGVLAPPPRSPRRGPWITMGAGVAALAMGVALNVSWYDDRAGWKKSAALASYGAGGAALVGGAAWWWWARSADP
ncbi:MAG: hypothetical protein EXR79_10225 [Myxococcales bacterium]|nr:hypothetical protein [Myxococcales bacterium]